MQLGWEKKCSNKSFVCVPVVLLCRTLSIGKGNELVDSMKEAYKGFGLETIFLMFQQKSQTFSDNIHEDLNVDCVGKKHSPQQLVQCFLTKQYTNKAFVPDLFIPICGQVQTHVICNRAFSTYLTASLAVSVQHRTYAYVHLFEELGMGWFLARISKAFTVAVYECMPKSVAHFISKV